MFLSSCELNPVRRGARKLLGSPQAMHAAVMSCFPRSQTQQVGRVLWRLDKTDASTTIYVVSTQPPDFTSLAEQAGWPEAPSHRTIDYRKILNSIHDGDLYSFRLTANPARAVRVAKDSRTKRLGHVTAQQQERWLLDRSLKNGFEIPLIIGGKPSEPAALEANLQDRAFQVIRRGTLSFHRNHEGKQGTVTLTQATYAGVLRVVNSDGLRSVLVNGLGPAKAYGCGLLTLAKPPSGSPRRSNE